MSKITGASLCSLLQNVYLDDTIKECVIEINDGVATIEAIDQTGHLYVNCKSKLDVEDNTLGIGNLQLLTKYTRTFSESTMSFKVKKNRLLLQPKGHGQLKYLLAEPDTIPSFVQVEGVDDVLAKAMKPFSHSIELDDSKVKDLINYMSFVTTPAVVFSVNYEGKVSLKGGLRSDHQFTLQFGELKNLKGKGKVKTNEYFITILGEFLIPVMKALVWTDTTPEILLAEDEPIVVRQDKDNIWSINLIELEE